MIHSLFEDMGAAFTGVDCVPSDGPPNQLQLLFYQYLDFDAPRAGTAVTGIQR